MPIRWLSRLTRLGCAGDAEEDRRFRQIRRRIFRQKLAAQIESYKAEESRRSALPKGSSKSSFFWNKTRELRARDSHCCSSTLGSCIGLPLAMRRLDRRASDSRGCLETLGGIMSFVVALLLMLQPVSTRSTDANRLDTGADHRLARCFYRKIGRDIPASAIVKRLPPCLFRRAAPECRQGAFHLR